MMALIYRQQNKKSDQVENPPTRFHKRSFTKSCIYCTANTKEWCFLDQQVSNMRLEVQVLFVAIGNMAPCKEHWITAGASKKTKGQIKLKLIQPQGLRLAVFSGHTQSAWAIPYPLLIIFFMAVISLTADILCFSAS